ncbi:MAG: NADPH-dependent assimilatory sulfite reductase hemoprotein subunit [Thermoanaerobaculia bacterium]|nr:NADPH-dependent assimilatory sulfite reductase hemoprotein subunit [Thermoanaerobaculia bacterium]
MTISTTRLEESPPGPPRSEPPAAKPSKVERAKTTSRALRGTVVETLDAGDGPFGDEDVQILKFHGIYQQDDRDARRIRRLTGDAKEHWFMVRAKIPGGELTPDQYLALDHIAGRHSDASLRLTTRQGVQLHGVLLGDLKPAVAAMNRALLSTFAACGDVERNVMAPAAPWKREIYSDARVLAAEIATDLCPRTGAYHQIWLDGERYDTGDPEPQAASHEQEPFYGDGYLPRKLKTAIAIAGELGDDTVDVHAQDIGIVLIPESSTSGSEGVEAVQILVGGGLGMTHRKADTYARIGTPLGTVRRHQVVAAVRAIAAVFRDHGNRSDRRHARLKYLIDEWGLDRFLRTVQEQLDFELSPPRDLDCLPHPDLLGRHDQGDGRSFYGVFVAEGRIADTPRIRLRTALRRAVLALRPRVLLTPDQNILFGDLSDADVDALEQILSAHGIALPGELSQVRRNAVACPALPTCGLALTESERVMPDIVRDLEAELSRHGLEGGELAVRMTGCPNGCARPYTADLGIVGSGLGVYDLYVGGGLARGRLADLWAVKVPQHEIAASLAPLFARWAAERVAGESLGDFYLRTFRAGSPRTRLTGDKSSPASITA